MVIWNYLTKQTKKLQPAGHAKTGKVGGAEVVTSNTVVLLLQTGLLTNYKKSTVTKQHA